MRWQELKLVHTCLKRLLRFVLPLTLASLSSWSHADYYACSNDVLNFEGSVVRTDAAGNVLDTFGQDVLFYPISLATGNDGLLYVADYALGSIFRFLPDGTLVDHFAQTNDLISSICFHPDGSLLVSRYEGGAIWRFAPDGTPLPDFVTDSGLGRHGQMAFDSSGNLYVCSWTESVILKYDTDGNALGVWSDTATSGIVGVTGMAFDIFGQMYVTEYQTDKIKLLDPNGFLVRELATTFGEMEYVTIDSDGSLLIPYFYDNTIHRFATDGTDLGEFASVLGSYQVVEGAQFFHPDAYTRIRGRVDSGDASSLTAVDDDPLRVCRFLVLNAFEAPIQVTIKGTSPVAEPSALTVYATSRMATGGFFQQELIMIDKNGTQSPTVRRVDAIGTAKVTRSLAADVPTDFVAADGSVQIRYNIRQVGPGAAALWCHELDHVVWVVKP